MRFDACWLALLLLLAMDCLVDMRLEALRAGLCRVATERLGRERVLEAVRLVSVSRSDPAMSTQEPSISLERVRGMALGVGLLGTVE